MEELVESFLERAREMWGEEKALLELPGNVQLPLELKGAGELNLEIKKKYGILYMKTPGGFLQ